MGQKGGGLPLFRMPVERLLNLQIVHVHGGTRRTLFRPTWGKGGAGGEGAEGGDYHDSGQEKGCKTHD